MKILLIISLALNLLFLVFVLYAIIKGRGIIEYNDFLEEYIHFKDYEEK